VRKTNIMITSPWQAEYRPSGRGQNGHWVLAYTSPTWGLRRVASRVLLPPFFGVIVVVTTWRCRWYKIGVYGVAGGMVGGEDMAML